MNLKHSDEAIEQTYDDRNCYDIAFIQTDPPRDERRLQALVAKVFAPKDGKTSP